RSSSWSRSALSWSYSARGTGGASSATWPGSCAGFSLAELLANEAAASSDKVNSVSCSGIVLCILRKIFGICLHDNLRGKRRLHTSSWGATRVPIRACSRSRRLIGGNFQQAFGEPRDVADRLDHLLILDAGGRDDGDGAQV